MKTCYKVVWRRAVGHNGLAYELVSAVTNSGFPEEMRLTYKPNEWTKGKGRSRLFCFKNLEAARKFHALFSLDRKTSLGSYHQIWRAEYQGRLLPSLALGCSELNYRWQNLVQAHSYIKEIKRLCAESPWRANSSVPPEDCFSVPALKLIEQIS